LRATIGLTQAHVPASRSGPGPLSRPRSAQPSQLLLVLFAFLAALPLAGPLWAAPTAYAPTPLSWEGEGAVPALLRLEAVFTPPSSVEIVQVLAGQESAGLLTVGLPDRSGAGGAGEVFLEANGLPLEVTRREAEEGLRLQELAADLVHTAAVELDAGEVLVLRSRVRLRDTWVPYLEAGEAPAWHGRGPLLVPYYRAEIDLRPARMWAGDEAEVKAVLRAEPPPLPHLPLLSPAGWVREPAEAWWQGRGVQDMVVLEAASPALETESLVPGDPVGMAAWLATDPGATPETLRLLAASVEARTGRTFEEGGQVAAFLAARSWYRPAADWGPDVPSSRSRRAAKILREAALGNAPEPVAEPAPPTRRVAAGPPPAAQGPDRPSPARPDQGPSPGPARSSLDVPRTVAEAGAWVEKARARGAGRRDVKILKNAYFAQYGHTFDTPWLQAHFEAQDWYQPRPSAAAPALSREEREIVQVLAAFEKELPADPVPEPPATPVQEQPAPPAPRPPAPAAGLPAGFLDDPAQIPVNRGEAQAWVERARELGLGPRAVKAARNAVFALHGRTFQTRWLQQFFEGKRWYRPEPGGTAARLQPGEAQAVEVLLAYEREILAASPGG